MTSERTTTRRRIARMRDRIETLRARAEQTLIWQVWERMLEIEFVDRSVALAGKAFVSFFPLVIVVASFMPAGIRTSIFASLTHRLGIEGAALTTAKQAFASSDEIRRATGILGLVLTVFFASSFTTALQRVYLRAWRRPPGKSVAKYTRGPAWLVGVLVFMAAMGGLRDLIGNGVGLGVFALISLASTSVLWWATTWFMLMGQVRWRVLIPSGVATGVTMAGYALSASIWMPDVVTRNQSQFGFFGVALALVTWFSGAAICIVVGACAGSVLAQDTGPVGAFIRGGEPDVLIDGASPSLPAPARELRLRDAFRTSEEDIPTT